MTEQWLLDLRNFVCEMPSKEELIQTPINHSASTKKLISESLKGRKAPNKGIPHIEETKEKIRQRAKGRTPWNKGKTGVYSKEVLERIKKNCRNKCGRNNPRSKTWKIFFEDGNIKIVKSLQTFAKENGYVPTSLRNLYNGKGIKKHKDIIKIEPV